MSRSRNTAFCRVSSVFLTPNPFRMNSSRKSPQVFILRDLRKTLSPLESAFTEKGGGGWAAKSGLPFNRLRLARPAVRSATSYLHAARIPGRRSSAGSAAFVLKNRANRRAVSAVIRRRSCTISPIRVAGTCSSSASLFTESPSGFMKSSRRISPGCTGAMSFSFFAIVALFYQW
jgi:hypothetical protein